MLPDLHPFFAESGMKLKANTVFSIGSFTVSSSMIVALIAALAVIGVVQLAMRAPKLVPTGLQNFVEWVIESLRGLLEQILGHTMMTRTFWFFGTIFIFILGCNLISLLPGVGSFGSGPHTARAWDFRVTDPWFRGANADVNMTAAMSLLFFFLWFYWCFTTMGLVGFFKHTFGAQVRFDHWAANLFFGLIFFFVGCIELVSIIVIRPIAFTFRLFGNIFGGEYLMHTVYEMAGPWFAGLALVPVYGFELLVAFIQALVFCLLTAIFTSLVTAGHEPAETSQKADDPVST